MFIHIYIYIYIYIWSPPQDLYFDVVVGRVLGASSSSSCCFAVLWQGASGFSGHPVGRMTHKEDKTFDLQ